MKCLLILVVITYIKIGLVSAEQNTPSCHPLDPLTAEEIHETVKIVNATFPVVQHQGLWAFYWITLKEPEKVLLLPYFLHDLGDPPCTSSTIPRRAFVQLVEKRQNIVTEVVVNLFLRNVESWTRLPSRTQTTFTEEENAAAEQIAKDDAQVQERCRQMGWNNISLVLGETWSVAYEDRPELKTAIRPMIVYMYGQLFDGDNHYVHPFDFAVTVDLALKKVIAINNLPTHSDYDPNNRNGNVCPKMPSNYNPKLMPSNFLRTDLHPIKCSQGEGPSFHIRGNEITWQKFKFRVGFNGREGLVIHHVSYQDGLQNRPLFYRISVAEVFTPYGDPRPPFHQKFPFDEGEFTLGLGAIDHKEAGICRGGVVAYMSTFLNNEDGSVLPKRHVICIHEEDAGVLWAHLGRDGQVIHTRSQRLTVTFFTNLGNYDYMFSWRFYQDATIEFQAEFTGIMITHLLAQNETRAGGFGTPVLPQVNGIYHEHTVALRLDTEIDGNINSVSTLDMIPLPDPSGSTKNPYGQGWTTVEHVLRTPTEARTNVSPFTGRNWMIRNPTRIHPYTKKPVGWKLIPHNTPLPFVRHDSPLHPRCAYTDNNVWVTKYRENQLYPAGFYLNASGLPEWVAENPNEDIAGNDIVLWYIFGYFHVPRVEDFPVMPVEASRIVIKPVNFFLSNPALDVAPP